jgi:hypothetical protein
VTNTPPMFYTPPESYEEHDIRLLVDNLLQGRVNRPDELAYYVQTLRQYNRALEAVTLRMDQASLCRFSQIFDYAQILVDGTLLNGGGIPVQH